LALFDRPSGEPSRAISASYAWRCCSSCLVLCCSRVRVNASLARTVLSSSRLTRAPPSSPTMSRTNGARGAACARRGAGRRASGAFAFGSAAFTPVVLAPVVLAPVVLAPVVLAAVVLAAAVFVPAALAAVVLAAAFPAAALLVFGAGFG